jgi:hypothetical protein
MSILLQRWVAGRVRTPGRFWRTVRRIDSRSIDLVTAVVQFWAIVACVLVLFGLSGCANYATLEVAHTSHRFAGPPFNDRSNEDSLDRLNACVGRERSGWYAEGCLGYKYRDGGFFGPKVSFDARIGRRFSFGER